MKRRKFLKLTAANLAALPLYARYKNSEVPANSASSPLLSKNDAADIVVVGAGAFGGWTAFYLQQMGAKVTLLDAYGPGNSRASSGGETRLIRADYGDDLIYTRMVMRAYELWDNWQKHWGKSLMKSTGRLTLIPDGMTHDIPVRKQRLDQFGVETEILSSAELTRRWPQINFAGIQVGMFNPGGAGGSALMARDACIAVASAFQENGGQFQIAQAKPGKITGYWLDNVQLSNGESIRAKQYVFACGPWLGKIFPNLLKNRLTVRRRDTFFFGIPAGDTRFVHPNMPEWGFRGSRYWGFPDFDGRGFKVAVYPDHNTFDPDADERIVNAYEVKRAYDFVAQRFPGMRGQPITETRVCQVTNTEQGRHFIIDQHPELENVWVMGAGNGHGFKHGPAVGEYTAKRILGQGGETEFDEAFKLK